MYQDDSLETVEMVDEQEMCQEKKAPASRKRRWLIAVAAVVSLGLIICAVVLCSIRTFTGEDLYYLFSDLIGCPTSAYGSVRIEKSRQLALNSMPSGLYVPIYEKPDTFIDLNDEEFTSFVDRMLPSLANSLGTEIPQYTQSEKGRLSQNIEVQMAQYHVKFKQFASKDLFGSAGEPQNSFVLPRGTAKTIVLEGEPLQKVFTEDEQENLRYISDIKEKVFRLIGRSFSDVWFYSNYDPENGYAHLSVCFYNNDDHPLKKFGALWRDTDYAYVSLVSEYTNGETERNIIMNCESIQYTQFRVDPSKQYPLTGVAKRITVSEAEKLLKKGYVFSGTRCCICARNDPNVDFSDYDHVELVYEDGPKKGTNEPIFVPFYKFYKLQRIDGDGTKIYAIATVPAVEVDGLAEYAEAFAQQYHQYHAHN